MMNSFSSKLSTFSYPYLFVPFDEFQANFKCEKIFFDFIKKEAQNVLYQESKMFLIKAKLKKIIINVSSYESREISKTSNIIIKNRKKKKQENKEESGSIMKLQDINTDEVISFVFPYWKRFPIESQLFEFFRLDSDDNFEKEMQNQCDQNFTFFIIIHKRNEIEYYVLSSWKEQ